MSEHPLDRPVWHALTGVQQPMATHIGSAVRIDPAIGYFAADEGIGGPDLLAVTRAAGQPSWLLESEAVEPPVGMVRSRTAALTQMVADRPLLDNNDEGIVPLSEVDAREMFALARATEPGPWESRTHTYGGYYGIREQGRLMAMAGTRLRPSAAYTEVSGVCTDPAARGRGYARKLMIRVMRDLVERGETPFLHCYSANEKAIALYRSLGFVVRRELVVSVLELRQSGE